jgi:hypothetical protein
MRNDQVEEAIPTLTRREEGPLATEQWKPSRQECLRNYEVKIRFLTIGCVISVGCKEIPFTSVKLAMECLNDYVERPYETCQIWEKRFLEEEE